MDLSVLSGLYFNLPKSVLIPHWADSLKQLSRTLQDQCPFLAYDKFSHAGRYLGYYIGPEGHTLRWQDATSKFLRVVTKYAFGAWGLDVASRIYNTYALSSLLIHLLRLLSSLTAKLFG